MQNKRWMPVLYALPIIISLALGVIIGGKSFSRTLELQHAQLLPSNKPLPVVSLVTHTGEPVSADKFRGHWSLVFFGFTSCPDFCPLELQKLAKVLRLAGVDSHVSVVFISVDPERDTHKKLAAYVDFFHPKILGLTGDNTALAEFANFFGAAYERSAVVQGKLLNIPAGIAMPAVAGNDYQVNHSTRVFVVNPNAEFVGSFTSPFSAEELWFDLEQLMQN